MSEASESADAVRATVEIVNKRGLHARASAKFVTLVAKFQSEITVSRDGTSVSGRSIMGLMMLGAAMGSTIEIAAQGPDAQEALEALVKLVSGKFEEDA